MPFVGAAKNFVRRLSVLMAYEEQSDECDIVARKGSQADFVPIQAGGGSLQRGYEGATLAPSLPLRGERTQ